VIKVSCLALMIQLLLAFAEMRMSAVNKFREKQKEKGNAEVRGLYCKKECHKDIKSHIKHILRLHDKGITDEQIRSRLARIDLEN